MKMKEKSKSLMKVFIALAFTLAAVVAVGRGKASAEEQYTYIYGSTDMAGAPEIEVNKLYAAPITVKDQVAYFKFKTPKEKGFITLYGMNIGVEVKNNWPIYVSVRNELGQILFRTDFLYDGQEKYGIGELYPNTDYYICIYKEHNDVITDGNAKFKINFYPDDCGDTMETAKTIKPGITVAGRLEHEFDEDEYKFYTGDSTEFDFKAKNIDIDAGVHFYIKSSINENISKLTIYSQQEATEKVKLLKNTTYYIYVADDWHSAIELRKVGNYAISITPTTVTGTCGKSAKYSLNLETGEMSITGSGDMADYQYSSRTPWVSYRDKIKKVTIASGITRIGNNAFYGCENLTNVSGCSGVTSIGINAFRNCTSLLKVADCKKVTLIEQYAFCGSTKFSTIGSTTGKIDIPVCTKIGGYTFYECKGINSLKTAYTMKYIGTRAFSNCTGMKDVFIGAGCATIGSYAFCGNTSLTTVTGCSGVTGLGDFAFYGNTKLSSVAGCNKAANIGKSVFRNCSSLTKVGSTSGQINLPAAKVVNEYAFSGCKSAKYISLGTNLTTIGQYAFQNTSALTSLYIRSAKLDSVGSYAFKGIKWNAVIYVPSSKVSTYKNGVLKGKGQGNNVVVKKI